jgi:hypothetical protein
VYGRWRPPTRTKPRGCRGKIRATASTHLTRTANIRCG